VEARDWAETFHSYHPGVTTMWLSGIGMEIFARRQGLSSDQLLGVAPSKPGTLDAAVTAGVIPMALAIALCIALSTVLLKRIAGQRLAFVGGFLLALDPFFIAYSKVFHVDALLSAFMFVSALFLLNHLHHTRRLDLILSGAFAGLAFLTKSPSIFLIPFAALAVVTYRLGTLWQRAEPPVGGQKPIRWLWECIRPLLIWGVVAAVVFTLLWPAMWVEPIRTVRRVVEGVFFHVETVHENPIFFNGQITHGDPGPLFYPATIAWKTTLVTLPAIGAGLVFALRRGYRRRYGKLIGLLAAYAVFFTVQMSLGSWKQVAYVVPAFPALDLIAAFGLTWGAEAVGRARWWQKSRWVPTAIIALALALQAGVGLPRHPYYGTHYNALLGGARVAQRILPLQDQGEGLDLAARFLNALPRTQRASATIHQRSGIVFKRAFEGNTSYDRVPWASYRVYYVNQVVRHLGG